MAKGTPNIKVDYVAGRPLPPDQMNDLSTIIARSDDDTFYDLLPIDPPPSASDANVRVGFLPLRSGLVVAGSGSARQVTIKPLRGLRSAIDSTKPRETLSGFVQADTVLPQPAVAGAGRWGLDLLYAKLRYVDSGNKAFGTTLTLDWAVPGVYVPSTNLPAVGVLPPHSSVQWNIPIAYVKNVAGSTTCPQDYVIDIPAGVANADNLGDLRQHVGAPRVRRAYSSANNAPQSLFLGGSSAMASAKNIISSTRTPAVTGRQGLDFEMVEIFLPVEITGGSSGAVAHVVVDDRRDWRKANFLSFWTIAGAGASAFAEDDPAIGATIHPTEWDPSNGPSAHYQSTGQSFVALNPASGFAGSSFAGGSALWAANLGDDVGNAPSNGVAQVVPTGDVFGLSVDGSNGALRFTRKMSGIGNGRPAHVVLLAFFSRAR